MRGVVLAAVVTVTAMLGAACSAEPAPPAGTGDDHGMAEYLDGLAEARQFRGVVEVRRGEDVLLRKGFGQADVARDVPNGPDTRFRIASVTKQFTALATLILQEQGKLRVADLVCAHLPDCPPTWRTITIEHLLTHTSGLFDDNDLTDAEVTAFFAEYGDRPTPQQLVGIVAGRPLEFAPGSRWKYSNGGYHVLGLLIERVSGRTYGEFLRTEILDPLGMADTAYRPGDRSGTDAIGYRDWTTPGDPLPDAVAFASGGMYSTLTDLSRWNRFLLTGDPDVVERATLAELLAPRVDSAPGERYGYGIETRGTGDTVTHGHGGTLIGFRSYQLVEPATGLSVVLLSNLDTVDPEMITRNLVALAAT